MLSEPCGWQSKGMEFNILFVLQDKGRQSN